MSLHKSLKGSSKIQVRRNVLKRHERIQVLQQEERWDESKNVLGLPKTRGTD
ncbi:MAG: small basic protein [Lentisphaeria bacterium]|nr:small basic protein [Lentisphaeria bacterium]